MTEARRPDGARRARAVSRALVALGTVQLVSSCAYLFVRGAPPLAEALALAFGNLYPFACAAAARRPAWTRVVARIAAASAVLATSFLAGLTGGITSPFALIFCTVPSADFTTSGPRGVIILAAASALAVGVLLGLDFAGVTDRAALPASILHTVYAIFLLHCVFVTMAVGVSVLRSREHTIRELARASEAAQEAHRETARLYAMMSHELRTPLMGLTGTLDLLDGAELAPADRRSLTIARASAASLRSLLDDVLELAKGSAGALGIAPAPCRPADVLRDAVALFAAAAESRGLTLGLEVTPDVEAPALTDVLRLRQILANLLSNAIKFTEKGSIMVQARIEGGAPRRLVVAVRDSGVGIPKEKIDRLFRPFTRVNPGRTNSAGAGLGLAVSRRLANAMGGDITAESVLGEGSTFTVTIQLGETIAPAEPPTPMPARGEQPLSILVADDSSIVRDVVDALLTQRGHRVVAVSDGDEAIERARRDDFDLLLIDLQMPRVDGFTAIATIREAQPAVTGPRIVVLSGDDAEASRARAREVGADAFLLKPIRVHDLVPQLAAAAAKRPKVALERRSS